MPVADQCVEDAFYRNVPSLKGADEAIGQRVMTTTDLELRPCQNGDGGVLGLDTNDLLSMELQLWSLARPRKVLVAGLRINVEVEGVPNAV